MSDRTGCILVSDDDRTSDDPGLGALLGHGAARFFDDRWEQHPLLVRGRRRLAASLLRLDDVESLLLGCRSESESPSSHGSVVAVDSSSGDTREHPIRWTPTGSLEVASIFSAYAAGNTIVANHVSRHWPAAASMCRHLESDIGHPVGCNLFLTPPRGTGFTAHYDAMDTFFVQVHGEKRWRVHAPSTELPVGSNFDRPRSDELGEVVLDEVLREGDVLFLPRGWIHAGTATDAGSIHLTFGVSPIRWLDVVEETELQRDLGWRRAIPLPRTGTCDGGEAGSLLAQAPGDVDGKRLARHVGRVVTSRPTALDAHFSSLDAARSIDLGTRLRRRSGLAPTVSNDGDSVTLHVPGSSISGPLDARPVFEYVARTPAFAVSELPEPLDDSARRQLARALVREGAVTIVGATN